VPLLFPVVVLEGPSRFFIFGKSTPDFAAELNTMLGMEFLN